MNNNPHGQHLATNLKHVRTRQGLSQQELARRVGVTRQTIGGIEGGRYSPSTAVALKLARALGCRVEDLFFLAESGGESIDARPATPTSPGGARTGGPAPVALAEVAGEWIAHPLQGEEAFRTELMPADGIARETAPGGGQTMRLLVEPLDDIGRLRRTVVLAGCSPALSLWARAAERWNPGIRIIWKYCNSTDALTELAAGAVHGAGIHLYDEASDTFNVPFVKKAMPRHAAALITMGFWWEGLMTAPGNPRKIKGAADLARPDITIVNREPGSGSRRLLERVLTRADIPFGKVKGFSTVAADHMDAARRVARGEADAAPGIEAVANIFQLHFIRLQRVRYDVVFRRDYLEENHVRELVNTLHHPRVKEQLDRVGGYDTAETGHMTVVH